MTDQATRKAFAILTAAKLNYTPAAADLGAMEAVWARMFADRGISDDQIVDKSTLWAQYEHTWPAFAQIANLKRKTYQATTTTRIGAPPTAPAPKLEHNRRGTVTPAGKLALEVMKDLCK